MKRALSRNDLMELAKKRNEPTPTKLTSIPEQTGAEFLKDIVTETISLSTKPAIILYLKDGLKGATANWTKLPNEIHDLMASQLEPQESILYIRMWRESWGYNRNYCRFSHSRTLQMTTIRSLATARRAMDGLISKKFIVRALDEAQKPNVNQDGMLYRIFTPEEIISRITEEGVEFDDIPESGVITMTMLNMSIDNKRNNNDTLDPMRNMINAQHDHAQYDHAQQEHPPLLNMTMLNMNTSTQNKEKQESNSPAQYDHAHIDHPIKDIENNNKDTLSPREICTLFYKGIGQEKVSKQKRERAESNIRELLNEGFTEKDISFAVKWTIENSKEKPYDFSLIKETIGQAMAEKEKAEKKEAEKLEREKRLTQEQAEREEQEKLLEKIKEHKNNLDDSQRKQLREKALSEIKNTKGIREEFITEILIEAKENEIIRKQFS